MEFAWKTFPNYGYIRAKLSAEELKPITDEINRIQSNFDDTKNVTAAPTLYGQIEREYELGNIDAIQTALMPYVMGYNQQFNYFDTFGHLKYQSPICLGNAWVNFQKKHEFNPPHRHSGVLSFVIWIKVPYDLEEEKRLCPGKNSNNPVPGAFSFCYSNSIGEIANEIIEVDKSAEGSIIVFPSKFIHEAFAFYTSDDYRISVSGNFIIDNSK